MHNIENTNKDNIYFPIDNLTIQIPKTIWYIWIFKGTRFGTTENINWWNRFWMNKLLGWKFEKANE